MPIPFSSTTIFTDSGHVSNGYLVFPTDDGPTVTVLFQHIPENLTDARKANYEVKEIAKRTEPLLIYQATGFREITFSLRFGARTAQEAYDLYVMANLLRRSVFPTSRGIPSICQLFLGPFFIYQKVVASGGSVTLQNDTNFSEGWGGMNCVIRDYSLAPLDKRMNHWSEDGGGDGLPDNPPNWREKVPTEVSVSIGLYVFLGQVWGTGSAICVGGTDNPNTQSSQQTGTSSDKQNEEPEQDSQGNNAAPSSPPEPAGDGPTPTQPTPESSPTQPSPAPGTAPGSGTEPGPSPQSPPPTSPPGNPGEPQTYTDPDDQSTIVSTPYYDENDNLTGSKTTTVYPGGSSYTQVSDPAGNTVYTYSQDEYGNTTSDTSYTDEGWTSNNYTSGTSSSGSWEWGGSGTSGP